MTARSSLPRLVVFGAAMTLIACAHQDHNVAGDTSMPAAESKNDMPIACKPAALTKVERDRSRSLRSELAAATTSTSPLANGYAFDLGPDAAIFQKAAEWISLERRCCPFLAFDLRWTQGDSSTPHLSITGPEGTKDFMLAEMPELPHGS